MKKYNGEKYILSFTTFPERFEDAARMIFNFLDQGIKDFHIVCTLFKDDYEKLSGSLATMADADLFEIIVAEDNLCPHLKYFYAMKKYEEIPIITVDDDRLYDLRILNALVSKYESIKYKSIISVCAPVMSRTGNQIDVQTKWCTPGRRLPPNKVSYVAMAEGFAGVLYPPYCFKDLDSEIEGIKKALFHDDLYLKVLAIKNRIPVTQIDGKAENFYNIELGNADSTNLATRHNAPIRYRCDVASLFNDSLIQGFSL